MAKLKFLNENGQWEGMSLDWSDIVNKPETNLPNASTKDEGKFLMVVDGQPTWVSIPLAEEAEF